VGGSAKVNRFVSTKPTDPCGRCVFMGAMIPKIPSKTRIGMGGKSKMEIEMEEIDME